MNLEKQNHEINKILSAKLMKISPQAASGHTGINFNQKTEQCESMFFTTKGLTSKIKDTLISSLKKDSNPPTTIQDSGNLSQSIYLKKPSRLKNDSYVNESQIHFAEDICEQSNLRNSQRIDEKNVLVLNSKLKTHSQILSLLRVDNSRKPFQDRSNNIPLDSEKGKGAEQLDKKLPQINGQSVFKIPRKQF